MPPSLRASATSRPNSRKHSACRERQPLARMDLEIADPDDVLVPLCRLHGREDRRRPRRSGDRRVNRL
jgi:hypothetical protein